MKTKSFTQNLPGGKTREVPGIQVELADGERAFDLETGRQVTGPAIIWQRATEEALREPEKAEGPEGAAARRGRPPGKAKPPDL